MAHEVFISYASEDRKIADAVLASLEQRQIRCWMAPRDISPGVSYASAIMEAIESCQAMVVIFSEHSNASPHVPREVERAVNHGVHILPLRIQEILPTDDMEYFLSSCHWLDAMTPPLEDHLDHLSKAIQHLLGRNEGPDQIIPGDIPKPRKTKRGSSRRGFLIGAAAALVLLAAGGGVWWNLKPQAAQQSFITLDSPPNGSTIINRLPSLRWSYTGTARDNLQFQVEVTRKDQRPQLMDATPDHTVLLENIEGPFSWRVRSVTYGTDGKAQEGAWSEPSWSVYYRNTFRRIELTRTVNVGITETSGDLVRVDKQTRKLSGFEIDHLQAAVARMLKLDSPGAVTITYVPVQWTNSGEHYQLLKNPEIDLLASGISITAEREQKFPWIRFSRTTFTFPQTLILREGVAPFAEGKCVLKAIGAAGGTTNEELAHQLTAGDDKRVVIFPSGNVYATMLDALFGADPDRFIDAALVDRPYTRRLKALAQDGGRKVVTVDVTPELFPEAPAEKIGYVLRRADEELLEKLNTAISASGDIREKLLRDYQVDDIISSAP